MTQNLNVFTQSLKGFFTDFWAFIAGMFTSTIGFFLPIRDNVHAIILFFIIEMFVGWLAKKKKTGAKFSLTIVYEKTIPRMGITIMILILAFIWDYVTKQKWMPTYNVLSWFFLGLLLLKIARNGYIVTKWIGFKLAAQLIDNKLNKGIDEDKS